VVVTVFGGMCRRPGPNVSVFFLPVPVGSACGGITSPGRTMLSVVAMAMAKTKRMCECRSSAARHKHLKQRNFWGSMACATSAFLTAELEQFSKDLAQKIDSPRSTRSRKLEPPEFRPPTRRPLPPTNLHFLGRRARRRHTTHSQNERTGRPRPAGCDWYLVRKLVQLHCVHIDSECPLLGVVWIVSDLEQEGKAEVIANEDGDRQIPSILSYVEGEELHGGQAKSQLVRNPKNTVAYFRDFLGQR
jgi:hypothetical protein